MVAEELLGLAAPGDCAFFVFVAAFDDLLLGLLMKSPNLGFLIDWLILDWTIFLLSISFALAEAEVDLSLAAPADDIFLALSNGLTPSPLKFSDEMKDFNFGSPPSPIATIGFDRLSLAWSTFDAIDLTDCCKIFLTLLRLAFLYWLIESIIELTAGW